MLEEYGLYNSFGVGRFSFVQSWLTEASRLGDSQASASNAGLPGDPNSLSLIARTWSDLISQGVVLLVSLLHNHQKDMTGMTDQIISM